MDENKILTFKATPAFGKLKRYFCKESIKHPAKINMNLCEWIIDRYTSEGDTVLDPMSGTYSTAIIAAMLGRNAVGVEYEDKFFKWGKSNKKEFEKNYTFPHGELAVVKGDARRLSKILKEQADKIVFSPPHSDTIKGGEGPNAVEMLGAARDHFGYWPIENEKLRKFSNEWQRKWKGYSEDNDNIGNLPHGDIDSVVFSPPYKSETRGGGISRRLKEGAQSELDIKARGLRKRNSLSRPVSDDPDNIENLDYGEIVDVIVSSPPYESGPFDHAGGHGGKYAGGIADRDEKLKPIELADENIGNKSGESYLGAMLQVYRESYKVLRSPTKWCECDD